MAVVAGLACAPSTRDSKTAVPESSALEGRDEGRAAETREPEGVVASSVDARALPGIERVPDIAIGSRHFTDVIDLAPTGDASGRPSCFVTDSVAAETRYTVDDASVTASRRMIVVPSARRDPDALSLLLEPEPPWGWEAEIAEIAREHAARSRPSR